MILIYSKMTKLGGQLVSLGVGGRAYLDRPDGAPDWGLRLQLTFLLPRS